MEYAIAKEVYEYNPEVKEFELVPGSVDNVVADGLTMKEAVDFIESNAKPEYLTTVDIPCNDEHERFLGFKLSCKLDRLGNGRSIAEGHRVVHWRIIPSLTLDLEDKQ
jgi:hypothetical protein